MICVFNRFRCKDLFDPSLKDTLLWLAIIMVIILFAPAFEMLTNKYIIPWTTLLFKNTKAFGIVFLCFSALFCVGAYKYLKCRTGRRIRWNYVLALLLIEAIWVYYRFINNIWSYYGIFNTAVCYGDVISFIGMMLLFYVIYSNIHEHIRSLKSKQIKVKSSLNPDMPIMSKKADKFNRKHFTKIISNTISEIDVSNGAYSIAITAPWGYGKTSFVNMLVENLKTKDGVKLIQFMPWILNPDTNITQAFFQTLAKELEGVNHKISHLIKRYLNLLDAKMELGISRLWDSDSLDKVKSDISVMLKRSNDRYVILIDDIDRLSSDEILELFRIIRGSANFSNVVFISCFDKAYLTEVLKESCAALKETYAEKFFQMEFPLPPYKITALREIAIDHVADFMTDSETDLEIFKEYLQPHYSLFSGESGSLDLFSNPRQLIRWLNNINMSYRALKKECNIADLADIELLKMFFPRIYWLFSRHFEIYFSNENGKVVLWSEDRSRHEMRFFDGNHKNLHESEEYLSLSDREKEYLKHILGRLVEYTLRKDVALRFGTAGYSYRYFYGVLDEADLSQDEFLGLLGLEYDRMIEKIDKDFSDRTNSLSLLCQTAQVTKAEDEIKIVRMIFYLSSYVDRFSFNPSVIMERLKNAGYENEKCEKKLFGILQDAPLSSWVSVVFNRSNRYYFPVGTESDGQIKYLSRDFMDKVQLHQMRKACDSNPDYKTVREFFRMSHNNLVPEESNALPRYDKGTETRETDVLMREYIIKNITSCFRYLYYRDTRNSQQGQDSMYGIAWPFNILWKSWDCFMEDLKNSGVEMPDEKKLEELGGIYKKCVPDNGITAHQLTYLDQPLWG